MGLHLPKTARRWYVAALLGFSLMMLTGCSGETKEQAERWAMPADSPATVQGREIAELWKWSWVAALATGAVVWALMFFVSWRYRRRSETDIPVQTRYNLPLEVFYTIAPVLMCVVFFFHTVRVQDELTHLDKNPDLTVEVTGQQWSWTFNYGIGDQDTSATGDDGDFAYGGYAYVSGTGREIPTLVLPVDRTIQFNLHSPDVIHDFGVPSFLMKMDVIPGRVNKMQVKPTVEGTYPGKCFELCGASHSRMLFNVEVVSQAEYDAYLADLAEAGQTAETPILGGSYVNDQAGLDDDSEGSNE